jgi:hypothetical protein
MRLKQKDNEEHERREGGGASYHVTAAASAFIADSFSSRPDADTVTRGGPSPQPRPPLWCYIGAWRV